MAQSANLQTALRIGSRGSPLALVQANEVKSRLAAAAGLDAGRIEIEIIRTTGDVVQDRPLAESGGKGLFAKEIEEALIAGAIDLAVHSAKDLPTELPAGLMLAGFLPREDPRDAFISRKAKTFGELPPGAVVGTASPRRQALVRRLRPDVGVVTLRGNVETRLRKLEAGEVDATLLAVAGLKRLGLVSAATAILDPDEFLPAVGQGAIAIETRADDIKTARAGRHDRRSRHGDCCCRRARLSRGTRRFVPYADWRLRAAARARGAFPRYHRQTGRK